MWELNPSANSTDGVHPLTNDSEHESTTTDQINSSNSTLIASSELPTPVSQTVVDERLNPPNHTTNQIDGLTARQRSPRSLSPFVMARNIPLSNSCPCTEDPILAYVFAANRDEQSNDRIMHPVDEFQNSRINLLMHLFYDIIWNNLPWGIQETEPHTLVLPVRVNRLQDIVVNYENGNINEDATVSNGNTVIMNVANTTLINRSSNANQMILTESSATEVVDELTYRINRIVSTAAQDDAYSSINSNTERQSIASGNNPGAADEDISNSDNVERVRASSRLESAVNGNIQEDLPTAPTPTLPAGTVSRIRSCEQAEDVEPNLAGPTENNNNTMEPPALLSAAN